jgi:hypothetical protein
MQDPRAHGAARARKLSKKVEAVEHWKRMASEICQVLSPGMELSGKSICLEPLPTHASQFDAAYWKLLKVQLINQSWMVVDNPHAAEMILSFESQLVSHGNRNFYCWNPTTLWGNFGYGLTHFFTGDSSGDDWSTRQDLLVTTFVRKAGSPVTAGSRTVTAHSQILYVPTGDADLYLASTAPEPFPGWAFR